MAELRRVRSGCLVCSISVFCAQLGACARTRWNGLSFSFYLSLRKHYLLNFVFQGEQDNLVTMHDVLDAMWLYENKGDGLFLSLPCNLPSPIFLPQSTNLSFI